MFAGLARRARSVRFEPNCDVYLDEAGATLLVNVEIAGAEPSELRVGVEERHLLIFGGRRDRHAGSRGSVFMKEIEYGDFLKKIHLPVAVTYAEAEASYQDGILSVRLPVSDTAYLPTHRTELHITVKRIPV